MNPFAPRVWRAAWYLLGYLLIGWALAAVALTVSVAAAALAVTIAGVPLLVAAASVIRGCANVERVRLRAILPGQVATSYLAPPRPGLLASATTRWKDQATWRELAYLVGLFIPLSILSCVVFTVWFVLLAGVAAPLWYWAPTSTFANGITAHGIQLGYFPNGPSGHGAAGLYIDSLPKALLAAVVCLVLLVAFSNVLVATARAHATVARGLLRAPQDPLAPAKEVLKRSGPLAAQIAHNDR